MALVSDVYSSAAAFVCSLAYLQSIHEVFFFKHKTHFAFFVVCSCLINSSEKLHDDL